jgi:hypothetical protein
MGDPILARECTSFDALFAALARTLGPTISQEVRGLRLSGIGTIALSCLGVSGRASRSALAAAVMALSSAAVGMATVARLAGFDIVLHVRRLLRGTG